MRWTSARSITQALPSRTAPAAIELDGGARLPAGPGTGVPTGCPRDPPAAAPPVARRGTHPLAERLFQTLLDQKGSDLHCSSFEAPIARIHGDMEELTEFGVLGPNQITEMMQTLAPPHDLGTLPGDATTPTSPTPSKPATAACA